MITRLLCAGLAGLIVARFLNKCIYRLPRDLSVVRPPSYCPHCSVAIAWFDNIPVISYLRLRGRCRKCRQRIAVRYLLVEILVPALYMYYVSAFGASLHALKYCLFSAILVTLTFTGIEERILPDEFTLGGAVVGLVFSWFVSPDASRSAGTAAGLSGLGYSLSGALIPSAGLWLVAWLYRKKRGREGLGFGDIKMLAMIGAFIGLGGAALTVPIWFLLCLIVGGSLILLSRKDPSTYELPTGPMWSIAALVAATAPPARWLWTGMNAWWAWLLGHF
jgi:leader peptidase (prepilin peptidase)/N-methyltransferase